MVDLPAASPDGSVRRNPAHRTLRRRFVRVPDQAPSTDAIFLVLRRMRAPLIILVVVFAVSVAGLTAIPGVDAAGQPYRMTAFDAFYLMSYTATTIGFGEIPYPLTIPQRMWVTACIFASVIGWAYTFGSLFALAQDGAFRAALARQSFARKVRRLRKPFLIVVGYGQMGRAVAETLDLLGRSVVIVDTAPASIDALAGAQLATDVPGLVGDARDPGVLGLAGLGSPHCQGVLALTDDDAVNLSIVMAVTLLRTDVPVIARSNSRTTVKAMGEFGAEAVVNPFDRYGAYLIMRLKRPGVYRLVTWLLAPPGEPHTPDVETHEDGRWVVAADGPFGREITQDLEDAGLDAHLVDPADGAPDVGGAVGFIAGSADDALNLALAGHARLVSPDIFLAVRQRSRRNEPLLRAFGPDSVFVPAQLTVQEALARVITPDFWAFVAFVSDQDDAWADAFLARLTEAAGRGSPDSHRFVLDKTDAPAAVRWLRHHELRLGDLFRHPDDRDAGVGAVPVMLVRDGATTFAPEDAELLRPGDEVVAVGSPRAFDEMADVLFYDHAVEYAATGHAVPSTLVWRWLKRPRARAT